MKQPNKLLGVLLVLLLAVPLYAGVAMFNGTSNLGVFPTLVCSTGLTCTKVGNTVSMVSGPAISTSSVSTSGTINSGGNFSVATNKFTVAAASGNTAVAGTENVVGNFSVNTSNFTVAGASGNTVVAGTLAVTGASTLTGAVGMSAAATVGTTLAVTGATTHTGGIVVSSGLLHNFMGWHPPTLTSGTSTTPSATTVYLTQVYIPFNSTLTGVYVNNAGTAGTNKYIVALFNSAGSAVANSTLSGITTSGTSAYQQLAFTGTYAAVGPGLYWIGLYVNGTTDRFYSVPAVGQFAGYTGSLTGQTFGTVAAITPPTSFTADVGPVAFTY